MALADEKTDQKPAERPVEKRPDKDKLKFNEKLNQFIQRNRRGLLVVIIAIVVILIGTVAGISIREKLSVSAFSKVDALNQRYEALKPAISGDAAAQSAKQAEIDTLLTDLASFSSRNSGFAAARSYAISAGIYDAQKKWPEAEKAWAAAAKAAGKSYLAPVSLYNAAAAAEEQGKTDAAIEYYKQVMNYQNAVSIAARAQFSIGRLEESRNKKDAALEAYRNLLSKWPGDSLWTSLAQSRIIILTDK